MGFLNRLPARQDGYYNRNRMWKNKGSDTAANRRTLVSPSHMLVNIGGAGAHAYERAAAMELDLNESWVWDTQTPDDYTVAANRAGKDFYIYACIYDIAAQGDQKPEHQRGCRDAVQGR